jgi:serine/threonine-protein kinase
LIARFQREVMLTSRLEHPATVEIYDYGLTRDGTFYFAMEYVDGLTLERLVERDGPQPPARVAHILKQVCESLREAHAKGLVHRDVKPPNIMLCERGGESDVVKVLDWGLIKDVRAPMQRDITIHARVLGTPVYMPPERVRDPAQADPLIDIYGLGAVAYFLVTGQRLFDAPNEFDLQRLVIEVDAPRASSVAKQAVPAALDDLIARCLAKDPAARPQHVDELIEVFAALLRDSPWTQDAARAWWQAYRATRGDARGEQRTGS